MFEIIDSRHSGINHGTATVLIRFNESGKYQVYIGDAWRNGHGVDDTIKYADDAQADYHPEISDDDQDFWGPGGRNQEFGDDHYEQKREREREQEILEAETYLDKKYMEMMAQLDDESVSTDYAIAYGARVSFADAKKLYPEIIDDKNSYDEKTVFATYDGKNLSERLDQILRSKQGMATCMAEVSKIAGRPRWECLCQLVREGHIKTNSEFKVLDILNAIIVRGEVCYSWSDSWSEEPYLNWQDISECVMEFDKDGCLEWAKQWVKRENEMKQRLTSQKQENEKEIPADQIPF